jgi:hypothetical protein
MAWTENELAALRRAYASGTLRVSYEGDGGGGRKSKAKA